MLSLMYNGLNFSMVTDLAGFYKEQTPEINKIRAIIEATKMLLHIPGNAIKLQVAEGERVYKIIFYKSSLDKFPLGWFVYIPEQSRIDLYDAVLSTKMPYIQWKNKKPVFKNYAGLLDLIKVDRLFDTVIKIS